MAKDNDSIKEEINKLIDSYALNFKAQTLDVNDDKIVRMKGIEVLNNLRKDISELECLKDE